MGMEKQRALRSQRPVNYSLLHDPFCWEFEYFFLSLFLSPSKNHYLSLIICITLRISIVVT